MIFTPRARKAGSTSGLALAIALVAGFGVTSVALEAPAAAQKKKEKAAKANYSKGFIAAYQPLAAQISAEGADLEAAKSAMPAAWRSKRMTIAMRPAASMSSWGRKPMT